MILRVFALVGWLPLTIASFCQSMLFTDQIVCEDGNAVNSLGCCAATGKCPKSCMSWGSGINGQGQVYCNCNDCAYKPKIQLSTDDRYLYATNYFRCRHGHPALTWNPTVAGHAQTWANTCPLQSGTAHSDSYKNNPSSGENVAAGQKTPEKAVEAWYNEVKDPGYTPGTTGSGTGHYTALIWKATTQLGCGQACPNGNMPPSHVCQYAEQPPNYGFTSAYTANVPQSNTPVATEETCCQQIYGNINAAPTTTTTTTTAVATTVTATTTVTTATTTAVATTTPGTTKTAGFGADKGFGGFGGGGGNGGTGSHKTPTSGEGFCHSTLYYDYYACEDGSKTLANGCCASTKACPTSCMATGTSFDSGGNKVCNCHDCDYAAKTKLSVEDRYLKAHNYFRCLHGHSALTWDTTVAGHAQTWANTCPLQGGNTAHSNSYSNNPQSGENVAAGQKSPEKAVTDWYNEIHDPGYVAGSTGGGAGHYTAMIWKATTALGCGQACPSGSMAPSHVCQYATSAPNFGGASDYVANVPQDSTPTATAEHCCAQTYGPAPPPSPPSQSTTSTTGVPATPKTYSVSSTQTTLTSAVKKGTRVLAVASHDGFNIGDWIRLGQIWGEECIIVGFGSLILDRDLKFDHAANVKVMKLIVPTTPAPGGGGQDSSLAQANGRIASSVACAMVATWISRFLL